LTGCVQRKSAWRKAHGDVFIMTVERYALCTMRYAFFNER